MPTSPPARSAAIFCIFHHPLVPLFPLTLYEMSDNDELQEPLVERLSSTPEPRPTPGAKRKRGSATTKIQKPVNQKKKQKITDHGDLDLELSINRAFSQMDSQLLADYLAQRTRNFESNLSSIELEDRFISGIAPQS